MGVKYDFMDTLHTFGEMAIIKDHTTRGMRSKLQDRGRPVMFLGTTHENTRDTYRFLSVITNRILMSCDIIWTGKSYGEYYNINPPQLPALPTRILLDKPADGPIEAKEVPVSPSISDVVEEEDLVDSLCDEDGNDFFAEKKSIIKLKKFIPIILPTPTVVKPVIPNGIEPGRVFTPIELVNILFPMPTSEVSGYSLVGESSEVSGSLVVESVDDGVLAYDYIEPIKYKDMSDGPLTFEQAWNHPCLWQRQRRRAAILFELAKMRGMCVWKIVKWSVIP
jgi:hypothetical protein